MGDGTGRQADRTVFALFIPQPCEWLTLNSHATRSNWRTIQPLKTGWADATRWASREVARALTLPLPPAIIEWTFCMSTQRRRDPDNYILTRKPILDALIKEGFWPDDNPDWVSNREIVFTVTKQNGVLINATCR